MYDPVILGNDIVLTGCGSDFEGVSVCSLTSTGDFTLVWLLGDTQLGTGTSLTIETGSGANVLAGFDTAKTNIEITIRLLYNGNLLIDNARIDSANINFASSNYRFFDGDIILTSLDTAIISIITAASVPEPGSLFLLAPGLVYVANRQRRKRKKKQTAIS